MKHKKNIRKQSDDANEGKEGIEEDSEEIDDDGEVVASASGMIDPACPTQGTSLCSMKQI